MKHPTKRLRQAAVSAEFEAGEARIVQHPDGYYWVSDLHEVGPFVSYDDARADMEAAPEDGIEPGETLAEAEQDIGVECWIDPETGAPAEEQRPRIEDH